MFYVAPSIRNIQVHGQRLCGLTWMDKALWFSDAALDQIFKVTLETGTIVQRIECPQVRTDLTVLDQHLMQVAGAERHLRVIDPTSGEVINEFANPRPDGKLCGIEATPVGVWMGYRDPPVLDLRSRSNFQLIDSIPVNQEVAGVTVADRFVAFASYSQAQISLLDPETKQVIATIEVNGNPTGLTWDGRWMWYCDYTSGQLRAIEIPATIAEE